MQSCHNVYSILYPELSLDSISVNAHFTRFLSKLETVKNVLKIVLIIVNINKDENKSLISNQFSLKNDPPTPHTHTSWRTILQR
jgi:hypothetical protein